MVAAPELLPAHLVKPLVTAIVLNYWKLQCCDTMSILYAKLNKICGRLHKLWSCELRLCVTDCVIWLNKLCLEHVLEIEWYVKHSVCMHSVDYFSTFAGASVQEAAVFVVFVRKSCWIWRCLMVNTIWFSPYSASRYCTWLRSDHSCKCWRSSCDCAMLQVKKHFNISDWQHKWYHSKNWSI